MADRPIFGIFEGGGAKGVAHVGALGACEDNGFFFVGVAGASAGAIVATLIAAGFSANEILNPADLSQNILTRHGKTPTGLLGQADWDRFKHHKDRREPGFKPKGTKGRRRSWASALESVPLARDVWRRKGHFSSEEVRAFVNAVLRGQLQAARHELGETEPVPERVTFADLDWTRYRAFLPLKVLAANVSTREGRIFDKDRTPDVEIAQAVAASIAIPIAFQPVVIEVEAGKPERFMDGGTVSNLPVWVFTNEKLAYERGNPGRPVPVVGFTLEEIDERTQAERKGDGFIRYLRDGISTALSGSQRVIQGFVDDLLVIPLHTRLTTLEFDASQGKMVAAYMEGFGCADRDLRHFLIDQPRLVRDELASVYQRVRAALVARMSESRRRRRRLVRASIVQRFGRDGFRVTYGQNMDKDSDDRLPLDRRGRGAPLAFESKLPQFALVGRGWSAPADDFMTKYERALANKRVKAIICIPIFESPDVWEIDDPAQRPEPCGVLSIDSDKDDELAAAFDDPMFMSLLAAQSTLLYPALTKEPLRGEEDSQPA